MAAVVDLADLETRFDAFVVCNLNSSSQVADSAARLRAELYGRTPALRRVCAPDVAIELLDRADPYLGYGRLPAQFLSMAAEVEADLGHQGFGDYLHLLIAYLAEQFEPRFRRLGIDEAFRAQFERSFMRMMGRGTDVATAQSARLDDDLFLKDFAIARQKLIPCSSHVVCRHSGIPRRVLFDRHTSLNRLRVIGAVLAESRGFRPYLENHVHLGMLDDFNPAGRERCYHLVAGLLRAWPESKGLIGTSWYYDPRVGAISPHLAYLHDVPASQGAHFIDMGEDRESNSGALARSPTRRALAEAGKYRPRRYMMVWSRRRILQHHQPAVTHE